MNANTKLNKILAFIESGGTIIISTHLKHIEVTAKALRKFEKAGTQLFKTDSTGSLYIARGKAWDCIDHARITGFS